MISIWLQAFQLCVADTPEQIEFTEGQINKFETVVKCVLDLNLPYCHCMNSAGGLWYHSEISFFCETWNNLIWFEA